MLKILAVCGNGMGSSVVLRLGLEPALEELGVEAIVECTSTGQAHSMMQFVDLIIMPKNLTHIVDVPKNVPTVLVRNLVSAKEVRAGVEAALREHYPDALPKGT